MSRTLVESVGPGFFEARREAAMEDRSTAMDVLGQIIRIRAANQGAEITDAFIEDTMAAMSPEMRRGFLTVLNEGSAATRVDEVLEGRDADVVLEETHG